MENFEIIGFPEIQEFMELEGFEENATLINPNLDMCIGDCTYLVDKDWLDEVRK